MADSSSYFEQSELWGRPPEPYQLQVRQDILSLVGQGPMSVLDVGCGDGFITNALPKSMQVTGVDTSAESLKHVKVKTLLASATDLPFEDKSFDLVMCNDVLEHLGDGELSNALYEMRRVAKKWILVTSPCMENLASGMTRCGTCGEIYHVNHHHWAFGVQEMCRLFEDLKPSVIMFSGAKMAQQEIADRRLRAGLKLLAQWDLAVCPRCGAKASTGSTREALATVASAAEKVARFMTRGEVDSSEFISVFALTNEPLVSLPVVGGDGLSVLLRQEGRFDQCASSAPGMWQGKPVLNMKYRQKGEQSLVLRLREGGCDFLCASPLVADEYVQIPAWFNAADLRGMSSMKAAKFPTEAEAVAICLSGAMELSSGAQAELERLRGQNEQLLVRLGQMSQLEVNLQNLRAENDALKVSAGQRQQLEVTNQNLRAENDALKVRVGRAEQLEIDLQNVRAENDALKLQASQSGKKQ